MTTAYRQRRRGPQLRWWIFAGAIVVVFLIARAQTSSAPAYDGPTGPNGLPAISYSPVPAAPTTPSYSEPTCGPNDGNVTDRGGVPVPCIRP